MLICSPFPKAGATLASRLFRVLGVGVIVMFAAAGLNVLTEVQMTRRKMIIIAISLTTVLGINLVPTAAQYFPGIWLTLVTAAVAQTVF